MKPALLVLLPVALMAQPAPPTTPAPPADPLDALAADSPFLPGTGGNRAAAVSTGPLELRSIVFVDGSYRFSIYDQGTNESNWVAIGERGYPFVARSFNQERDALTVEHQGRTMTLALQPARMASAGNVQQPSPSPLPGQGDPANPTNRRNVPGGPNAVPGNSPGGPGGPAINQPSQAEAQRLQNLADEIRRRRGNNSRITLPQSQPRKN